MAASTFFEHLGVFISSFRTIDTSEDKSSKEIVYLQSQNGNICREVYPRDETTIEDAEPEPELKAFVEILEEEVQWMSEALGMFPFFALLNDRRQA
jgi:hypothetical protein